MHELLPPREARAGRGGTGARPLGPPVGSRAHRCSPWLSASQGVTRLLLTAIPFFREVIVSSFSCEHCGWSNTEVQSAGRIQDQGVRYTLAVRAAEVSARRGPGRRESPACPRLPVP